MNNNRRSYLIFFVVIAALQFLLKHAAAEYRIQPGIAVSEEYNDNIFLAPRNPVPDYITRVLPSVHFWYAAPVWEWDIAYSFDYRYYANRSKVHDSTHLFNLSNHTSVVRDALFVDLRDVYQRVSLDTTRDFTQQSIFVNQTDTNELLLSPYLRMNLFSHTSGTTGYQYRNVWYREASGINKTEHTVFADFRDELSLRTALLAGTRYVREDASILSYNRIDVYAGPRYEYAQGSTIWVLLGNSWFISENGDNGTQGSWDVGISHRFVTYTITFNAALSYIDDPTRVQRREDRYVASLRKDTERSRLEATLGHWEYRDVLTKRLQNTRDSIGGTISYQITPALRGAYSPTIDRYEDSPTDTFSMLYINVVRLEYLFPANTVLALDYRFAHGYSPDPINFNLNYDNNSVTIELRKLF